MLLALLHYFDLIGLLLTNHIIAQALQINGIPEFI